MKILNPTYICSVFLAAATLSLSACHSDEKEKAERQEAQRQQQDIEVPPVEAVTLTKGKLSSSLQVPGELMPYQQVSLYAKVNSYVKQYVVDVGSEVHKGQLLIQLEAPEMNSQLNSAKARIRQQEAIYLASKATYDRLFNTAKTPGTIAQNDLEQADARRKADLANMEAAKSAYQEVASNLAYLQIRAPFDGVVSERNASLGAYVGPAGQGSATPLLVIQQQRKLRLVISVPEVNTGGLSNRESVNFTVRALPNQNFTARIKRLAGALDPRLRSERLEMDVDNSTKKLLPGMYAEVNVPMQSKDSTFVIPTTALVQSTEKVFVIRIDANHHAQWVDVQKGLQGKDGVEIYGKGLNPGDKLVKTATDEIRDGQPVKETPAKKDETKI
ncbi:efflux RND transporter periplasmic adaptor subunit [Mucilaginibacter lacusdianchii]|uniref:efflux RND transporter periplasmic adaptor subunit n=1 Tax=Mucilaginibacter lacusdianchii TaxID=2684211 RepID=UPI00131A69F8|nr:efflux RND transporter periplasmic adaptor subunit [Mucilaginibacter sp. JXJ CY 39]